MIFSGLSSPRRGLLVFMYGLVFIAMGSIAWLYEAILR
jgi:hypothetical protein